MAKKKSTADILAALRAETKKAKDAEATDAPEESAAPDEPKAEAPAKPKGAAPKSTKDILAALRAEGGGGAKSTAKKPAEKQAPAAAATAKKPAPAAGGEKPSVQEMIKAAREGRAPQSSDAAAPAKPAAPARRKPAAIGAAKKGKGSPGDTGTRRNFLVALLTAPVVIAWAALVFASTAFLLGLARFLMPNVLVEPPSSFKIGPPSDFAPDTVTTKFKAEFGVWIVNTLWEGRREIYAISSVCTHLGCTPNWLEGEQKFKCPCHGSGFYINGVNFEGPAPRPLERVGIALGPDGLLEVDKSVKFQQEMGQWDDAASTYVVG